MKAKAMLCLLLLFVGIAVADTTDLGVLAVKVKNESGEPLQYANISVFRGDQPITGGQTNARGKAMIRVPAGTYRLMVSLIAYWRVDSLFVEVRAGKRTKVPVIMKSGGIYTIPTVSPAIDPPRETLGRIALRVCDQTGQGLADCTYELFRDSLLVLSGTVNPRGMIVLANLKTGIYNLKISRAGFRTTLVKEIPVRPMTTSNCIVNLSEYASGTANPQIILFVDLPQKHSDEVRTIDLERLDLTSPDVIHCD